MAHPSGIESPALMEIPTFRDQVADYNIFRVRIDGGGKHLPSAQDLLHDTARLEARLMCCR